VCCPMYLRRARGLDDEIGHFDHEDRANGVFTVAALKASLHTTAAEIHVRCVTFR